ncbi:TNT domain-containing protein [Mesorhizobium japonicum]|uniref:TNT domain-containing protein n=1 Tax=Mesorhizobium japonicum TaxID=2066070 RepID=UPI003B59AB4F
MVVLVVDTDAFLEAGECSRSVASNLRGAVSRAGSGLSGSGQMAGSDENGLRWAGSYDAACGSLLASVTQWLDAVSHLARRLTATGCYYEITEWANAGVTDIQVELPPATAPASCPYIPSAAGGARRFPNAGNPAFEWVVEQIANLVGDVWPDGDTTKLDHASTVWHRLADDLDHAGASLTRTTDALHGITTPEIPTIHDDIQRLRSYATRLASACRTLGTACTDLSGQITYVHLQTEITIGITVAAIAVTVAAGAGLTPLTFGISDVAAAGGVAAEVGGAVATITGFITELASSISVGVGMIAESAAALLPISTELATTIGVTLGDLTATTVLWGTAGATENIAVTAITQPDTDLLTAAETGFITWGTGGALGTATSGALGTTLKLGSTPRLAPPADLAAIESEKLSSPEFLQKWSRGPGEFGPDWIWPPDDGFDGIRVPNTLTPGTRIDRITATKPDGEPADGSYASPEGNTFPSRSLPPDRALPPFVTVTYEVVKPLPPEVLEGKVAPWFDRPGGGFQYQFPEGITKYVDDGYLRVIGKRSQ